MEMRPFGKHDWYGFAGAESWDDYASLISTERTSTHLVILDKNGGNVFFDINKLEEGMYLVHEFKNHEEAREFARKMGNPQTPKDFIKFGFKYQ